jgi:MFS family permease
MDSTPSPATFHALRDSHVRAFVIGEILSSMATRLISLAVGWELYERTNDPWALGLIGVAEIVPVILLMLPAGHAADRFPRRNVAMLGFGLIGLAAMGLALVSGAQAPVGWVYLMLAVIGTARALASPSIESMLPQLVPARHLGTAQAWIESGGQLSAIGGVVAGGILLAAAGAAGWAYLVAAGLCAAYVAVLRTLPAIRPPHVEQTSARDLFAGLAFIRRTPVFLAAITLDLFAVLFGGAVALLPVFAKDILAVGPSGLGVLQAASSVGALLTGLYLAHRPPPQRPGRLLLFVVAAFGLATIVFGLSSSFALSLVCLFSLGAFDAVSNVIRGTLQQTVTPDHVRGRVSAAEQVFVSFSNELGAVESGAVAALFGSVVAVVSGGVGTLVVVAVVALACPALARIGPLHTLQPRLPTLCHVCGPGSHDRDPPFSGCRGPWRTSK